MAVFNSTSDDDERRTALAELVGDLGDGAVIRPPFHCDYGIHISMGAGAFMNFGGVILDCAPVIIGALAQIGPNVQLLAADHPREPELRREGWEMAKPVHIGANTWLGGGVIVCPGVTIGDDSIIGAGSVVVRDILPAWWQPATRARSSASSDDEPRATPTPRQRLRAGEGTADRRDRADAETWAAEVGWDRSVTTAGRSTMGASDRPVGSVPNTRPPPSSRREAQNASATSAGECRTISDAWNTRARRSTSRRARTLGVVEVGQVLLERRGRVVESGIGTERRDRPRPSRRRARAVRA